MPNIYESVEVDRVRRSSFDMSFYRKFSCKMGQLVPIYLQEIYPKDEFFVSSEVMIRLAPMIAPLMHRVNVFVHYFFVPNRIVWSEWEDFITGGEDGTLTPTFPEAGLNNALAGNGSLADYLGVPDPVGDVGGILDVKFSRIPFRAYTKVYNDYYRDENVDPEIAIDPDVGVEIFNLRFRRWEKDYFTSALPFAQRGDAVGIPVDFIYKTGSDVVGSADDVVAPLINDANDFLKAGTALAAQDARIENLETDGVSVDINELRRSSAIQRWLELSARGGARYIEIIKAHFDVTSDDARLQRAEYLGGGRQPIVISEVLNTSATAGEPQGNMAGHGISVGTTNSFKKMFTEHGYVIGIMSVIPRTQYQQGIDRHWSRRERFDYMWPIFADLGEQEVKNKELYWNRSDGVAPNPDPPTDPEGIFGYQQRFADLRENCSSVHGDFRAGLDFWHMGQIYDAPPALNSQFVSSANVTDRIFAVQDGTDTLWCQVFNLVGARRALPYFSKPELS